MDYPDEMTAQERAALLGWWFAHGECMTTAQAARLIGLDWEGTRVLLSKLARVIPIYRSASGAWEVCAMGEAA